MLGNIIMKKDQEDEKRKLNNSKPQINRGIELLLRNREKKSEKPKTFQVKFGKMISLLSREFDIYFEFHFNVKK